MNHQEFKEILAFGRERRSIEFKHGGPRTDKKLLTKVIRASISMGNNRDGGKGGNANVLFRVYLAFLLVDISDHYDGSVLFNDEEQTGIQDVLFWSPRH